MISSAGIVADFLFWEEKEMKRILTVMLALALMFALTACGGAKTSSGVEDGVLTVAME